MQLEDELRKALQRQEPSPGFAERVAARLETPALKPNIQVMRPRRRMFWAAAIAAMLALGAVTASEYRRMRAEHQREQAVRALRITVEKLNLARTKVLEATYRASHREN
jgi:hypothetical protein